MELKIINETVDIRDLIFEGTPEQGFESDILLPDYCPEVRRILKCHTTPKISQCYQNGEKVNIDGFIVIKIYYLCDENKIHSYDNKIPFSKILELRSGVDGVSVSVSAKTDYVNCRAVNQRRFDVRGAISISARITGVSSETIVSDATGDGVQLKKKTIPSSAICAEASAQFSVQEEGDIEDNGIVNAVLRSEGCVYLTDVKIIPNKVILKGDLKVTTLYTDADGTMPKMAVHTFPISRIIDIDGINSESKSEIKTDVVLVETLPKQNENGEFCKLSFDVKVNIFVKAYDTREITVSLDAYSTQYDSNYSLKNIPVDRLITVIDETFTYRTQIELSNTAIDRVVDLWACERTPIIKTEGAKLITNIPFDVFSFFIQEGSAAEFAEKNVTAVFEQMLSEEYENILFDPDVKLLSCEYGRLAPNKVEIKLEIKIVGAVICRENNRCINELTVDDNKPKKDENAPALTIYYCDKGESVWSIAKKYNTCTDLIMTENNIDSETVENSRVILIPSVN